MPLLNSQYDAIMRRYDATRERHRHELEDRTTEVYKAVPAVRDLDREVSTLSLSSARARIMDPLAPLDGYRDRLEEIGRERAALLREHGYPADYLSLQYDCPLCRDTGYVDQTPCICFRKAVSDLLYSEFDPGPVLEKENFRYFSFEWYPDTIKDPATGRSARELAAIARKCALTFVENMGRPDNNLYIYGSTGTGKTFLTNCIAKELLDRSYSVLYFSAGDYFRILGDAAFGREGRTAAHEKAILECDCLIIDDLGTERTNSFVAAQLFSTINERIAKSRSTIISSNLEPGKLPDMYTERVSSRLITHYTLIKLIGEDIRIRKKIGEDIRSRKKLTGGIS